jgi:hypothetical protein
MRMAVLEAASDRAVHPVQPADGSFQAWRQRSRARNAAEKFLVLLLIVLAVLAFRLVLVLAVAAAG